MLGSGLRVLLWQPLLQLSGQAMVDKQDAHIVVRIMEYIRIVCIDQISDGKNLR